MTTQTTLFDSNEAAFQRFMRDNGHVYDLLVSLAREARAHGKTKIGIRALWERARWELWLTTTREIGDPKLNNNLTSRMARLIMKREPDLVGIFDVREIRAL